MTRKKRLFIVVLLTLLIDDICRYINFFIEKHPTEIEAFDFVMMRFDSGTVINLAVIFVVIVSVIYFLLHFFSTEKN